MSESSLPPERPKPVCISTYRPTQGAHCFNCKRVIPRIPNATADDDARLEALLKTGSPMEVNRYFRERLHVDYPTSKLAVMHMYDGWQRPVGPPCEKCGSYLRTPRARMCVNCGWRRVMPAPDAT